MRRAFGAVVVLAMAMAGCGPTGAADVEGAPWADPGEADESELCQGVSPNKGCIEEDTPQARDVLAVVNDATDGVLRSVYRLSTTQLRRVNAFRHGPDLLPGTSDDRRFTSLYELRSLTGFTCCTVNRLASIAADVRECRGDDGLCPPGCSLRTDANCKPSCGDQRRDEGELCDGDCPSSCDDGDACTVDTLEGAAETCSAVCRSAPITACLPADGCCAPGCTFRNDSDCQPTTYSIGENAQMDALYVDDDVLVSVNGVEVFRDWGTGANRPAISFQAAPGDWVAMRFFDTVGWGRAHGEIWLAGPGVAPQKVAGSLVGGHASYPAQPNQPFDIVVFQVPAPGQQAATGCFPEEQLDRSRWRTSSSLTVYEATTQRYHVRWAVSGWSRDYDYHPDCGGWVQDVFVVGSSWAVVQWNTITNQLRTYPVAGHPYDASIARSCAQHAVNTLFPAGDLTMLSVNY